MARSLPRGALGDRTAGEDGLIEVSNQAPIRGVSVSTPRDTPEMLSARRLPRDY